MPTTPPLSAARHADAPKVHHEQQAKQAAGDPAQQHDRRAPLFARDRRPRFICALGLHTAQDSAAQRRSAHVFLYTAKVEVKRR
jgi:hypothetical protein